MESNLQELKKQGVAAFEASDFNAAIQYFTRALQIEPSDPETLNNRAIAYRLTKNYDMALADATQAVALNPDDALYHSTLAAILTKVEKQLEAIEELDKAIQLDPQLEYIMNKVVILKKLNRYAEALSEIDNVENQNLLTPELTLYKGIIFMEVKKFWEAEAVFRSLLNGDQHQLALHYLKLLNSKLN